MRNHNFAFVDIEATGLNLLKNEIIEVGCVLTTPELEAIEEFAIKIKPENLAEANPTSLKISHYKEEDWKKAVSLKKGMEILSKKTKDCIIVGHNVSFDVAFLENAFSKTGVQNMMHYHKLDTISLAWAKLHHDPSFEHFSLRELCQRFGIVNEHPHTALSDARAAFELYKKLLEL